MSALDDLVRIGEEILSAIERLGESAGAGPGQPGGRESDIQSAGAGVASRLGGALAAGATAAAPIANAAARSAALGGTTAEIAGSADRAAARGLRLADSIVPLGSLTGATEAVNITDRAQASVSQIAEQIARAGGQVSRGALTRALRAQNVREGRVENVRNDIENIQNRLFDGVADGRFQIARGRNEQFDRLIASMDSLVDTLRQFLGGGGQTR